MTRIQRLFTLLIILSVLTLAACAGTATSRSTGTYIDDKTISAKVEAKLAAESLTAAMDVNVETYDGVVQLSGFVDNLETLQKAEQIARSVAGVKKVENNLILRRN